MWIKPFAMKSVSDASCQREKIYLKKNKSSNSPILSIISQIKYIFTQINMDGCLLGLTQFKFDPKIISVDLAGIAVTC